MQKFSIPSPDFVRRSSFAHAKAMDGWLIMDMAEFPDFVASHNDINHRSQASGDWKGALNRARYGDISAVAQSDELLAKVSSYMPAAKARGYVMDVAGAVPIVPTYLSGNPINMRRRIKTESEYAPLAIFYDGTDGAAISSENRFKKGLIVLALVRALAGLRPVELYIGGSLDDRGANGCFFAVRIETSPLDLARAAWALTSDECCRGLGYAMLYHQFNPRGGYSYLMPRFTCRADYMTKIVRQAMPHVSDVLAIPCSSNDDPMIADPESWLKRTFNELAGQQQEAA